MTRRMRHAAGRRSRLDDHGSVAAEFAVAVPAVLLVLALGVAALSACARQVRLQDAAASAARLVARGDSVGRAQSTVAGAAPGARLAITRPGDLVCADASAPSGIPFAGLALTVRSCALATEPG